MKKRIFPLLIVILVMFTMMPMTAGTVFADADTKPPVIDPAVSVDKQTVKAGETVTLSATVTDDKAVDGVYFYCWNEESKKILDGWAAYDQPDNKWKLSFNITENTSPGLWRIEYISAYDTNNNGVSLYDLRYDPQGVDLSAGDFTVEGTNPDLTPPVIDPAVSVDKQTVKAGETVTLSATVTDDKAVDGVYFYCWNEESKKILDGWAAYDQPDNKWKLSFNITENTSPGLWRIEYISAYDTNNNGVSLYDLRYDPQGVDLSAGDFTVEGTNPDLTPPVIDPAVSVDKQTVKAGETVTLSATVTDDKAVDGVYFYCWNEESKKILDGWAAYDQPDNKWKLSFNITENTSPGLWRIEYISAYDTNSNGTSLYDVRYDPQGVDLSASDFTVVRTCHVTFDTRGGSKVTAQDVLPGENAVRPDDPTKGAGAWQGGGDFSGWYADEALTQEFIFNNPITEDTTVYAKWAYVFSVCSYDKTNNADYDGGKYMVLLHGATEDDLCYGGCNFTLYDGDAITLKAVPDTGYKFTGWFKGEYIGMVDDRHTQVSRPLDMSDPDNLLSSDPEYAFVIDKYTVICPVFEVCTDHQWSEEKIQKATPDAEGRTWRVCTICGAEETGMPIPKVSNISLEGTSFTYTGKAITPKVTVANAGEPLSDDYYTVTYFNNTNVGTATVKVTLKGDLYEGSKELTFTITKPADGGGNGGNSDSGTTPGGSGTTPSGSGVAPGGTGTQVTKSVNPMKVEAKTVKVKYSKLRNKKLIIKTNKAFTITDARGKVTFKVVKYDKIAKKKIKVSKAGKITVKKGLKKGTYKLKVNVTAAGNTNYEPLAKMVTVKIKVK